jgi:hypothetical protein
MSAKPVPTLLYLQLNSCIDAMHSFLMVDFLLLLRSATAKLCSPVG